MKHNYEENRQRQIDNAKDRIESNEHEADRQLDAAHNILNHIPPGQPILVGHHSEKRHRKDLERADNAMFKSRTAQEKAEYYRDRVKAMESNTAISSDDPEAIEKLTEKLKKLTEIQEFMKAANKCIRKKDKAAFLLLDYGTEALWEQLLTPDCFHEIGFPRYKLTNNSANIRRVSLRLSELKALADRRTKERTVKCVRVVDNVEANRIQLIFPSKPPEEVREWLHKHGFHYSYEENAWQRFLNNQSLFEVELFFNWYDPDK